MDKVDIRFIFTEEIEGYAPFTDAFYFPLEQWPVAQEIIDAKKKERVDNHKYRLSHPVAPVEPTLSDYMESRKNLMKQIEDCSDKIDALGTVEDLTVIQAEYEDKVQKIKDRIANK